MKAFLLTVLSALALSGCSGLQQSAVPMTTAYNLDGTFAGNPAPRPRQQRVKRPVRDANASIETTGSVGVDDEEREQAYLGELIKTPHNTPEWLALRKKLDALRVERNTRERAGLTICRNC